MDSSVMKLLEQLITAKTEERDALTVQLRRLREIRMRLLAQEKSVKDLGNLSAVEQEAVNRATQALTAITAAAPELLQPSAKPKVVKTPTKQQKKPARREPEQPAATTALPKFGIHPLAARILKANFSNKRPAATFDAALERAFAPYVTPGQSWQSYEIPLIRGSTQIRITLQEDLAKPHSAIRSAMRNAASVLTAARSGDQPFNRRPHERFASLLSMLTDDDVWKIFERAMQQWGFPLEEPQVA